MGRILRYLAIVVVVSAVAVAGYFWVQGREPGDGAFTLVEVVRGEITEKAVAVGQIQPRLQFRVKSKISGIVRRCYVEVGDPVDVGDPLFEIEPDPTPIELVEAERQVEASQSAFNRARADWDRTSELARQGIISSDEVDAARETFELARIALDRDRDGLTLLREGRIADRGRKLESVIRAPAAGIVLARRVDPGDPVVPLTSYQEGTELATVADMSDLIFKGTVDEIDVGRLGVGLAARLKVGALPDVEVAGHLSRIAPQAIDRDNAKLFEVEIEIAPGDGVLLRAGYSAIADLVIREKNGILVIPERLVEFDGPEGARFVEVLGATPEAEPVKVQIETGLSDGLNIEVTSGLEEGDRVVQRPPRDVLG